MSAKCVPRWDIQRPSILFLVSDGVVDRGTRLRGMAVETKLAMNKIGLTSL